MRRGLGKGLGMGYKNLVPKDPMVHSLSAKGVKTKKDVAVLLKTRDFKYNVGSDVKYVPISTFNKLEEEGLTGYSEGIGLDIVNLTAKGDFAKIIYQQLGGNQFAMMTGAKNFSYSEKDKSFTFRIGRNAKGVNMVRITLTPQDLYDVEFLYATVKGVNVKNKVEGIYADQLKDVFEENTGLYTKLFAKKKMSLVSQKQPKTVYHKGIYSPDYNKTNMKNDLAEISKLKYEIKKLLYDIKNYKGEDANSHELMEITVLKDKLPHFNFLVSHTDVDATGYFKDNVLKIDFDKEKNAVIQVEYLDTKNEKIGKALINKLNRLNDLEIGESVLYTRTTQLEETSLPLEDWR